MTVSPARISMSRSILSMSEFKRISLFVTTGIYLLSMAASPTAIAQDIDVISDAPLISFDDTTDPDAEEWFIFGRDGEFLVTSNEILQDLLQAQTALQSVSLGFGATAGGSFSAAIGDDASAAGNFSTAVGDRASAPENSGTALGTRAVAGGGSSTALGRDAASSGSSSVALGRGASSAGNSSTAVGLGAAAAGNFSSALGYRASAPNPDTIVLGGVPDVNFATDYADVAIGTTAPLAPLHVARDDGTAQILVEETDPTPSPRTLFRLASAGSNAKFEIDNTSAGVSWAFTNSGSDFRVSRQGSGTVEFRVDNAGNAVVAGDLEVGGDLFTNVMMPSDRSIKQHVESVDPERVLEKVSALPLSTWEYTDRPGQRHMGPMAQDFRAAFGLGADDRSISIVDASGVALASIQALNRKLERRNLALERDVDELKSRNSQLEERLSLLEVAMGQMLSSEVADN
jgi:hypothetical protein